MTPASHIVLITGCSDGGIGSALAKEFHRSGCTVIATARRIKAMSELPAGERMKLEKLDVCSSESVEELRKKVIEEYGHVDILVNNAGILAHGPILEVPIEDVSSVFDTNVTGVLRMTQAFVPLMIARRQGLVVNIGSISGLVSNPFSGVYAATKKALHALTETLRQELYPFDVNVMLVAPGIIKSQLEIKASASTRGERGVKEGSLWQMVEKQAWFIKTMVSKGTWTADDLAKPVVAKALSPSPPTFYSAGTYSKRYRIIQWLPEVFLRWGFVRVLGLARMRTKLLSAAEEKQD